MPSERALAIYAYMCKQENRLEAELAAAKADVQLWVKRAKLAYKKGAIDMGRQAKQRATAAKVEFDRVQAELTTTKRKKSDLRRRNHVTDETDSVIYAEMLVEQFRMQGFSPEEAETNAIAKRMEAELAVAEMKGEPAPPLAAGSDPAPSAERSDAVQQGDDLLDTVEDPGPAEEAQTGLVEEAEDGVDPEDELLRQFDQLLAQAKLENGDGDSPNLDDSLDSDED